MGSAKDTWVVVGLGNPGDRYHGTRHNLGRLCVEELARLLAVSLKKGPFVGRAGTAERQGQVIIASTPETFMNRSGQMVQAVLQWFKVGPGRLVVAHDDLDLAFGRLKVAFAGSGAGHRGIESIVDHLGTQDFYRLRLGIGRPQDRQDPSDYVLSPFAPTEVQGLAAFLDRGCRAVFTLVDCGLEAAKNMFHGP